jgi:hypothetical protein
LEISDHRQVPDQGLMHASDRRCFLRLRVVALPVHSGQVRVVRKGHPRATHKLLTNSRRSGGLQDGPQPTGSGPSRLNRSRHYEIGDTCPHLTDNRKRPKRSRHGWIVGTVAESENRTLEDTLAIITTDPDAKMTAIHNRQQVVLEPREYEEWLEENERPPLHLLRILPDEHLVIDPLNAAPMGKPKLLQPRLFD